MGQGQGGGIVLVQAAQRGVDAHIQPGGQGVADTGDGVGVAGGAHQGVVDGFFRRIQGDLHTVQAGLVQIMAQGAGEHTAVGVQTGDEPLGGVHQFDQVVAQGGLAAGEGQLGDARGPAFLDDGQPLVGVQLLGLAVGLAGGVAMQAFLVAVPGTVLDHGADEQVHAVGRRHVAGIGTQVHGLDLGSGRFPPGDGKQGIQHGLQIGGDLFRRGALVDGGGGFHSIVGGLLPFVLLNLVAFKGTQGFHEVGEQNGPGNT